MRETNAKIVTDRGLKLATEPTIKLTEDAGEIANIFAGKIDLSYSVACEVVPQITLADFKDIKLEKPVADVTDADVDEGLRRIADQNRTYTAKPAGAAAERDNRVDHFLQRHHRWGGF